MCGLNSTLLMKKILFLSLCFFVMTIGFSQQEIPFTKNKQFYLNGGSTIIGNNILSKHSKKPFNDASKINDEIKMVYVDVDNDKSTFSSSQANLELPTNSTIEYAVLYWSGIYSFNHGEKKKKGNKIVYKGDNQRDDDFNTVKLKIKGKAYVSVTGDLLFDGYELPKYKENAPYVCSADITHLFNKYDLVNGVYTVANIKATQGYISGGSAAGWFIYVVYKNKNESLKAITTYNGFSHLSKNPETISLKDFKTLQEGQVNASISLVALEGDTKLKTDECLITTNKGKQVNLHSKQRPKNNFFNGTISNKSNSLLRFPNSKNTLGFDVLQMEIPNENNRVINNNTEQVDIQLKTKSDRFFLYFTAFETDIQISYLTEKINKDNPIVNNNKKSELEEVEISAKPNLVKKTKKKPRRKRSSSLKNTTTSKGYYLVSNVFSSSQLAEEWKQFLIGKGYSANSFINRNNNWIYVYVYVSQNKNEAIEEINLLKQIPYLESLWVCKID